MKAYAQVARIMTIVWSFACSEALLLAVARSPSLLVVDPYQEFIDCFASLVRPSDLQTPMFLGG